MPSNAVPESGEDTPGGNPMADPDLILPRREPSNDREPPESSENGLDKPSTSSVVSAKSDAESELSDPESEMSEIYDPFENLRAIPPDRLYSAECGRVDRKLGKVRAKRPMRYERGLISHNIDNFANLIKVLGDRIGFLEYEIENMRQTPRQPHAFPDPPAPPPTYSITEYGDYHWFSRRYFRTYFQPKYVVEVKLTVETNGIYSFLANHQDMCLDVEGDKSVFADGFGPVATFEGAILLPHRVRITSSYLLKCLGELSNEKFSLIDNGHVFISPFKMFVRHEKEIRAAFRYTEAEVEALRQKELLETQQKDSSSDEDERYEVPQDRDFHSTDPAISPEPGTQHNSEQEAKEFEALQFKCEHLRLLVHFFDGSFKPILDLYHSIKSGTITQIPFDYLWYLFHHGQEVVQQGGHLQVSRVLRFTGGRDTVTSVQSTGMPNTIPPAAPISETLPSMIKKSSFHVDCYFWGFDGEGFRPVVETIDIKPYAGFRDIASLPVYPLAFHEKSGVIRPQLLERGDKFLSLSKKHEVVHRHYTGLTLESNCTNAEEIDSRIIIDQRSAILEKPKWKPPEYTSARTAYDTRELCTEPRVTDDMLHLDQVHDNAESETWFSERKNTLEPPEDLDAPPAEDKILLPYYLYGFILRSRKWAKFSIELINNIEDKNSFDDLVLQEGHARAIKALVENHNRGPGRDKENGHVEVSMDLVKGKGKGVIILLHGEPGVGKTSTAECIADYTLRPLYPITCGDIGETADKVEESLEKTFQLAHKWGCVLLLDEADVFLQERNREDLRRNAVVSVFLRVLEYYSGILFLTTNRVGIIDQAFRSRIHLSLFYPALDKNATLTIWRMHLDTAKRRFKERGQVLEVDKKQVLKFAKEQFKKMKANNMNTWNGRQIRNAFQTAIALAEYRAQGKGDIHNQKKKGKKTTKLTVNEFEIVQQTSDSFDEYLRLTQMATQSTQARLNKTRRDDFDATEQYAESRKAKSAAAKLKGRSEKKKVKVEPDSDSTIISDSSEEEDEEEESSELDDSSQSDSDAASEQQKSDSSDEDVEEIVSKKAKGKKSISGKKDEDVAVKSEKTKTKKKESKKRVEGSDEEHETEKVEKKRSKK